MVFIVTLHMNAPYLSQSIGIIFIMGGEDGVVWGHAPLDFFLKILPKEKWCSF